MRKADAGCSCETSVLKSAKEIASFNISNGEPALNWNLSDKISLGLAGVESSDLGMEFVQEIFAYENTTYGIPTANKCVIKAIAKREADGNWVGFGYDFIREFKYKGRNVTLINSYAVLVKENSNAQNEEEKQAAIQIAKYYDWCVAHPKANQEIIKVSVGVSVTTVMGLLATNSQKIYDIISIIKSTLEQFGKNISVSWKN